MLRHSPPFSARMVLSGHSQEAGWIDMPLKRKVWDAALRSYSGGRSDGGGNPYVTLTMESEDGHLSSLVLDEGTLERLLERARQS